MTGGDKPKLPPRAEADLAARRDREAAALRANLRRRKEQQRPRSDPASGTQSEPYAPDETRPLQPSA